MFAKSHFQGISALLTIPIRFTSEYGKGKLLFSKINIHFATWQLSISMASISISDIHTREKIGGFWQ